MYVCFAIAPARSFTLQHFPFVTDASTDHWRVFLTADIFDTCCNIVNYSM